MLSFFANGTPGGVPTFALLDGVSLTPVPEPSTIFAGAFMLLPALGVVRRMLRKPASAQA